MLKRLLVLPFYKTATGSLTACDDILDYRRTGRRLDNFRLGGRGGGNGAMAITGAGALGGTTCWTAIGTTGG